MIRDLTIPMLRAVLAVLAVAGAAERARAQSAPAGALGADALREAEREVAVFLDRQGLGRLHEAQLRDRLTRAAGDSRIAIASELGALYLDRLERETDSAERREVERLAAELLEQVPGLPTVGLRIDLLKTRYLGAELVAERARLRLAGDAERAEAVRTLAEVHAELHRLGDDLDRMVNSLEAREERVPAAEAESLREQLTDARRWRSLAKYYAGWAGCYYATMSAPSIPAGLVPLALEDFGTLLNAAPGRPPTWGDLPKGLLRYDHIARAAMGAAMCFALGGDHATASRWLERLEEQPDLSVEVRAQLRTRQIIVDASSDRWFDINGRLSVDQVPLTVTEARLLAVLAGESVSQGAEDAARRALRRLIELGEIGHVLEIAQMHGSLPIDGDDFIVLYVRGLRSFREARALHESDALDTGHDASTPAERPTLRAAYREAATLLAGAAQSPEGRDYQTERVRAELLAATSMFFAADLAEAAGAFESIIARFPDAGDELMEQAMWYHALTLRLAADQGRPVDPAEASAAAQMYLSSFPDTERAARLILRQTGTGLEPSRRSVETLLAIEQGAPLYEPARRQAAAMLYRLYRSSSGAERDRVGADLVAIGPGVLDAEVEHALGADADGAARALERAILLGRQLLAVCLGMRPAQAEIARETLATVDRIRAFREAGSPAGGARELEHELNFRRLQLALADADRDLALSWLETLRSVGGRHARAGEMAMYRQALERAGAAGGDARDVWRERVVEHGAVLIADSGTPAVALADAPVNALYEQVSRTAELLWQSSGREEYRTLSLRLAGLMIEHGRPAPGTVVRVAELAESAGDRDEATRAWLLYMSSQRAGTPEWFRSRYQSLRLVAQADPGAARDTLDQLAVLYPSLGPEPWATRLRELASRLGPAPSPVSPRTPGSQEPSGDGGAP